MHSSDPIWVRKLIGKPAFLTIADCESEARRIHYAALLLPAPVRSVRLIHSDADVPARLTASATGLYSSGENRACTRTPRTFFFGNLGRPIFAFIKTLRMT